MPSQVGDYLKARFVRHAFRFETWVPVSTLNLHLYTVSPSGGAATGGTEATGAAYAAKSLANSGATDWDEAGGAVSNKNAISFGTPTGGNWGTIVAAALKDTSGNVWAWATLTTPVATTDGVPVIFGAGKLVFRMVNP